MLATSVRIKSLILLLIFVLQAPEAFSSDFGTEGLITIPTARSKPDGRLSLTVSGNQVANMFNLSYQVLPRVETTFRYSIFNPRKTEGSKDVLRDRSYGLKLKLLSERRYLPELSLGIRDILGTGAWAGEYLVSSKAIDNFDFSLGMGWGRYSERGAFSNPLSLLSSSFDSRNAGGISGGTLGGKIRGSSFFRGPVGFFGGGAYKFEKIPLSLLFQYSSDAYDREVNLGSIKNPSPMSYAVAWDFPVGTSISLSFQQNEYFGLNLSYHLNTKENSKKKKLDPFYSSLSGNKLELKDPERTLDTWYARSLYDFERSGLRLLRANLETGSSHAQLEIENLDYALTADAVSRALLLSELHLPQRTKSVELSVLENGHLGPRVLYYKTKAKKPASPSTRHQSQLQIDNIEFLEPRRLTEANKKTEFHYFKLATSIDLNVRMQLFDPEEPLRHQVYALLGSRLIVNEHINLWGAYALDINNDFSTARRSDSVLPHVRSDLNLYLTEGASGLNSLFVDGRYTLGSSMHFRGYLGVLEEMYSGIGFESLYHEYDKRWALGASLSKVIQRDYRKNFNHLKYHTALGFVSLYYASPFYNLDFALHAGQYLARDRGFTFEARRTFANGFEIAAYFTRTNVSAEEFGEGSFDKGLVFRIPFNHFSSRNTRGAYSTLLRSMNRDGGRRLEDFGQTLWYDRRSTRLDRLLETKQRMLP